MIYVETVTERVEQRNRMGTQEGSKNVTIADIARQAGVSKATVSRAISGNGYVSDEKRQLIESIVESTGFVPSATAQVLSTQVSDTIGVIIPEADNSFFSKILAGVSEVIDRNNYTLLLCHTENSADKDYRSLQIMLRQRVRGLIFTPSIEYGDEQVVQKVLNSLKMIQCPVVVLDRPIPQYKSDVVSSDNFCGAYLATQELIKAGHKRIGIVAGDMTLTIGRERFAGYREAMKNAGLPCEESDVIYGEFKEDTAYAATKAFLAKDQGARAFFVSNNLESIGFLRAVFESDIRIPEDMAYIGFDEVAGLNLFEKRFSYMDRHVTDLGRKAAELLIDRLAHPELEARNVMFDMTPRLFGSEKR